MAKTKDVVVTHNTFVGTEEVRKGDIRKVPVGATGWWFKDYNPNDPPVLPDQVPTQDVPQTLSEMGRRSKRGPL